MQLSRIEDELNRYLESLEKAKKEPDLTKRTERVAYLQSEIDKFTVKAKPFGKMQDLIDERERLEQELENSRHRRGAPFGSTVRPLQKDLDQASDELGKAMSDAVTKRSYVQMAITTFEVYTLLTHSIMQCVDSRREALTLAMPSADLQASATVCITHEGPFGCTGQFNGSYQLTCSGDGTRKQDQGGGTVNFRPDGWIDLRFKSTVYPDSNPRPLSGEIDGQGRVRIDRIDRDAGITESWFGQFNLVSIENGKQRPTGGGNSEIRVTDGQGNLQFSCQGTFQLTDEGAL